MVNTQSHHILANNYQGNMVKDSRLILVGIICSAHGIKANVLVKSYTDPIDRITTLKLLNNKNIYFTITKIRITRKGMIICKCSECKDRNQAEALTGTKLYCMRDDLPKINKEEFYFVDLKNLEVLDLNRQPLGFINGVFNFGGGDLIEVKFSNNLKTKIYPFTKEVFPEITKDYAILSKLYKV